MTESCAVPRISIITACYNSTQFIGRLYQSLLAQECSDFEWICVDDCSTDDTVSLLRSMEAPGSGGMQVYRLPLNTGGSVAVAAGVQKARGEIILIFDHDDELRPDACRLIVAAWPAVIRDASLSGLMFPVVDGSSGRVIGDPVREGTRITTTWLTNRRPDISDATFVFKSSVAKEAFTIKNVEEVALFGVILNQITSKRPARAEATPIRRYHRDNPDSQTLNVRVSRKTVSTYAAQLNDWDRWYWFAFWRWVRHAVTLLRFAKDVHGSMTSALPLVRRTWLRLALILLMPIGAIVRTLRPPSRVVVYPIFEPEMAENLIDLRS